MSESMTSNDRFGEEAAALLASARRREKLSLREVARRAGTSHATLHAYESGTKIPSVATFLRILNACGFAVSFDLAPRIRWQDGIPRGEELEQVLRLAAEFPARSERQMNFPLFGARRG